jgi:hypothetical protein
MADGTLIFDTRIDTNGMNTGVAKLKVNFQKATDDVKRQAAAVTELEGKLKRWQAIAAAQQKNFGTVTAPAQAGIAAASAKLDTAKIKLEQLNVKAAEAGDKLQQALSPKIPLTFMNAAKSVQSQMARFKTMLDRVILRAAVMMAVFQGIQKIKEYFGAAFKTNQEYVKAVGQLKAALMTMAQPIIQFILPAFIKMIQVLALLMTYVARFFSMLSGKSLQASQASAKGLYDQQQALDGVGKSAKNAEKSMASFDEVQKIGNTSSSSASGSSAQDSIAPDFSALDDADGKLQHIAQLVGAIAAGLLLWKISSMFTTGLQQAATLFAGLALIIGGCYLAYRGFSDALNNGVNWKSLGEIIGGVILIVGGLALAFGTVAAGVGAVIAGLLILYVGFEDIIKNGVNLQNTLLVIAGIMATGLGIALLTGSLIPLLIAGILSIIVVILSATGNLNEFMRNLKENIFGGLIEFITGVFTGDWTKAWEGVKKVFKGIWNGIVIILESAINLIIKGLNWLIDKINSISFDLPDIMGGGHVGFSIPALSEVQIPRLATGAVIPPNREFMAVLGDQKNGTNIETPEDLLRRIVREEGGGDITINEIVTLDGEVVYRNQRKVARRHGKVLA